MADLDFERAFGSLAYAELEQKAPGLFPYLVGFQLVKKTDNETHAIGVFGFKVGEQWYYGPVFWLNGKLKGYDLLYIVSQDLFVPLQESWINYITNRQPYIMGEPVPGKPNAQDFTAPDLVPYTRSPITKQSSLNTKNWLDVNLMMGSAHEKMAFDLTKLSGHPELAASLLHTMASNTKFAEAVFKFYSPAEIHTLATGAKTSALRKEAAENFITGNNVKVMVQYGSGTAGPGSMQNLSAAERTQLLGGDAVVTDNRKPAEISEIYSKPDFERMLAAPSQSGLWDVLFKGPTFKQALVICNPVTIGKGSSNGCSTVVLPDEKLQWLNATTRSVTTRSRIDPANWGDMYKKFSNPEDITVGDIGMLVSKDFTGTIPFRVTRILKGSDGISNLCVIPFDSLKRFDGSSFLAPSTHKYERNCGCSPVCCGTTEGSRSADITTAFDASDYKCEKDGNPSYGDKTYWNDCDGYHICFSPKAGGFVNVADTLTVNPDNVKFVKLGKFELKYDESEKRYRPVIDEWDIKRGTLNLGKSSDIDSYLFKQGMHELTVKPDRDETMAVLFRGENKRMLSKNAALKHLIVDVGLSESDARHLVKHAKVNPVSGLVKLAAPTTPSTSGGFDSVYRTVTTSPSTETIRLSSNAPGINRQQSMAPIDPNIQGQAEQAAAVGQKDVFDLAVLNGLIRVNDVEESIRDMLKNIILGNDRIGRILFMYYWHFDQFSEKYGSDDMKQLEDTLRTVFKSAGDLILFLKQKSIEPSAIERASVDIGGASAAGTI